MNSAALAIWTVYENPSDYPGKFVLRRSETTAAEGTKHDPHPAAVEDTLRKVREHLPWGLVRLERNVSDDPVIIETWL